jgi:hypothetical protein
MRRLEGSRWRLRTLAMGIEWRFCTWKTEDDLPSRDDSWLDLCRGWRFVLSNGWMKFHGSYRWSTGRGLSTRVRWRVENMSRVY